MTSSGPLTGTKVIEIAGIGPGPFCAMLLADMGADVVRVDRASSVTGVPADPPLEPLNRGRRSIGVDLKHPDGVATVLRLVEGADVLIEGFRPGVAERLGIGPDACRDRNPGLIYGRMTGWGQEGRLALTAGHDIDYIAVAGALGAIGRDGERPVPPLNLVGDFGGGAMFLAFGITAALVERAKSGVGQVVDAAMVDGTAVLTTMFWGMRQLGMWHDRRGVNLLDSGAPFYEVYTTSDGGHMAVGAIEPQFYAALLDGLGLTAEELPHQYDQSAWPAVKARFAEVFVSRTRAEWEATFTGTDACVAPVLGWHEAPTYPPNAERNVFVDVAGLIQPAPAPRFSRTPGNVQSPPPHPGQHTDEILADFGFSAAEIAGLRAQGAVC